MTSADLASDPRSLLAPDLRTVALPGGVLARALGAAFFSMCLFWVSCAGDPGPVHLGVWFSVVFVFCVVVFLGPALVGAARTRVALDEGGVRCTMSGYATYWPFDLVGQGSVGVDAIGIPLLVLRDRTDRPFLKIPLLDARVEELAHKFVSEYERRRVARPDETPRSVSLLERNGRRLSDWLATLSNLAASAGQVGYRAQGVDPTELEALVQDRRHPAGHRAAAAFTLLGTKSPRARSIVEAAVTESAPPMLVLLVRASNDGKALVSDELFEGVRDFLEKEDLASLEPAGA